jgi:hypothetical protein
MFKGLRDFIHDELLAWKIHNFPDRKFMTNIIIPFVRDSQFKRILFVGCQRFTSTYPRLLSQNGGEVWTIDIDPTVVRWGAPNRHIIGDASVLDTIVDNVRFDCIIFNGVLGWGIDDEPTISRTFLAFGRVLRPASLLVLGWNIGRTIDPRLMPDLISRFEDLRHSSIPSRMTFPESDHCYDFFVRRSVDL